jgi:serine/threonine protein phosphatase PrpC
VLPFLKKLFGGGEEATSTPEAPVTEAAKVATLESAPADAAVTTPINTDNQATAPLSPDMLGDELYKISPPQLIVGCGQSIGLQRDHNEDSLFSFSTTMVTDSRQISFGLFIIADGMGGHQHGEIASGIAVRAMASLVLRKAYLSLISLRGETPEESLQEILQEGIMEAHRSIMKDAVGGGTTLTAALIFGEQLMIAHVGDSRAYAVYTDGSLRPLTRDHSLVKRLEELGQITSAEAAIHPQRNVLYRALGQGEPFDPDINSYPLPQGGYLLICSDGLWGQVSEREIIEIIIETPTPEIACHKMVGVANANGGPDNISVILVRIPHLTVT